MLELRQLQFSGIGRFVEEQSIDFSSLNEFIQVDGQNNNTGGSSGSGKSTVFNALDYLLGLNDKPATVLQSRQTENHISVSGSFLYNGMEVTITRAKKLEIVYAEKTIKGSSALAEEEIDKLLGMNRKIFRKLLHKRQKEGGFFLEFTPAKMHEFLIDCLDLAQFRKYDEVEDIKIKSLTLKRSVDKEALDCAIASVKAIKDAFAAIGPAPVREVDQETVLGLKKKMDEAEGNLRSILAVHTLNQNAQERERPETVVVPYDRSALEFEEKSLAGLRTKLNELVQAEKDRIRLVKEMISENAQAKKRCENAIVAGVAAKNECIKIAEEIKKIRAQVCPTCEQGWITEQYGKQEKDRLTRMLQLKAVIDEAAGASEEIKVLETLAAQYQQDLLPRVDPKIDGINEAIPYGEQQIAEEKKKEKEHLDKQNAVNKIHNERFAQMQTSLRQHQEAEANQARGQLDLARRVFDGAVGKLKAYEESRAKHETTITTLKTNEESFTKKIAELEVTISALNADIALAEETKKAIKMYLSYSFDDALESIGERATEIIRCIPNTKNATIQFDGTKETKDGKIKEEVNAVLGMDGEEGIPINSLSGGERTAVDIAVDLAVIDFIETKSGKGTNIFILDEPFDGLGPVETEMALEVIKNSNTNKKIIIVSHDSEVKQMVQDRLVVVRDGLTSKMEIANV